MKKIICMFLNLSLLVCIVGCSQTKDSDNHVVQDYSEEYEVSPYGSEEALDTLDDLKISMSTEKDLDLKHLSFLIENTSDKEYRYSPNYFEIEAEQSGTWYLSLFQIHLQDNSCPLRQTQYPPFLLKYPLLRGSPLLPSEVPGCHSV